MNFVLSGKEMSKAACAPRGIALLPHSDFAGWMELKPEKTSAKNCLFVWSSLLMDQSTMLSFGYTGDFIHFLSKYHLCILLMKNHFFVTT